MLVGCGALGCAAAELLARAGVGRLVIVDRDIVEFTNLQRQCLFDETDAREQTPKALAAATRIGRINSSIRIEPVVTDLTHRNAEELADQFAPDVLLDGSDNFQTRFLMNDLAVKRGIPLVYAGVVATGGMQMTIRPSVTACLRCVFDTDGSGIPAGPTCDTAGVLGPAVMIAAAYQASETLKLLVAQRPALSGVPERAESDRANRFAPSGSLVHFDLAANTHRAMHAGAGARRADCPCCGERRFEYLSGTHADTAAVLCGRNAVQIWPPHSRVTDLRAVYQRLAPHGQFTLSPVLVRGSLRDAAGDQGEGMELTVFADGRTLVRGTSSIERARSVHARYVGG